MIFVDDDYVSSVEEVNDALSGRNRDVEVTVVFTQAKTSEFWLKKEINTLQSAIIDFLSDTHAYPHSEYMENCREVFDAVLRNVGTARREAACTSLLCHDGSCLRRSRESSPRNRR